MVYVWTSLMHSQQEQGGATKCYKQDALGVRTNYNVVIHRLSL